MRIKLPFSATKNLFTGLTCTLSLVLAGIPAAVASVQTASPIKHVVVIFQENVSFDHYFATYPYAPVMPGEPSFQPRPGTPHVNGLTPALLNHNPNSANPFRLDRLQAATCDMDHNYTDEQKAYDAGRVDKFITYTANHSASCDPKTVMGYYDGDTVTAMWNYAQDFAMSDNFYNTTYGPSSPGAINLVSGQTHGVLPSSPGATTSAVLKGTLIGDLQPLYDDCTTSKTPVAMTGRNVGTLLNAKGVTWGWFEGGFKPTARTAAGQAICGASHTGSDGQPKGDYIPHHEPFQFYASTANPHHLPPSSIAMIGHSDQANHQYDLSDFWAAVAANHLPAVSFLKAPGYQDGHAGYSDPLAEQAFLVDTINRLQQSPAWKDTAILITYDDSDGWYDHQMPPLMMTSVSAADALTGPGQCGTTTTGGSVGRCGYGPRLPLMAISPFAKVNFVDHHLNDQSSILRFIEDNWHLGRIGGNSFDAHAGSLMHLFNFSHTRADRRLILDPRNGTPVQANRPYPDEG